MNLYTYNETKKECTSIIRLNKKYFKITKDFQNNTFWECILHFISLQEISKSNKNIIPIFYF